ncbi:MAG: hypothetical protein AB8H03_01915 [Saprospiraceae bacterium]
MDRKYTIHSEINEPIQLGIFSKHIKNITSEKSILYLEDHLINQEKIEFKVIVNKIPKYISTDPFGTRSGNNRINNLIQLN